MKKIKNFINAGIINQEFYGSSTSDGQKIIDKDCISSSYQKNDEGPPVYKKLFKSNLLNSQYIELFNTKLLGVEICR